MTPSKGPRDEFSDKFYGTAAENNRYLRKELIDARNKRDKYLEKRLSLLLPFLPEKVTAYARIFISALKFVCDFVL